MTEATDTQRDTERLLDFLNTLDVEAGTDSLADDATAREIRDALRAAVAGHTAVLPTVSLSATITPAGFTLVARDAATQAVAAAVNLTATGTFSRVKLCPAHDCAWAFYDRSRNGSRTWCDMAVCGNREKARAYRSSHAAQ